MNQTAHEKIREDLKACMDGELRFPRRLQVSHHVDGCPNCKKEMEEMKKITHNLFASEGPSTLSDPLRARLLGSIGDPVGEARRSEPLWHRRSSWIYGGTGAVAVASVIMFGVTYTSTLQNEQRAASSGAEASSAVTIERTGSQAGVRYPAMTRDPSNAYSRRVAVASGSSEAKPPVFHARMKSSAGTLADATPAIPEFQTQSAAAAPALRAYSGPSGISRPGNMIAAAASVPPSAISAMNAGANVRDVDNEAQLGVEVDDVEATGDKIGDMVKADGGYVATNNLTVEEGVRIDQMTVKIPSKDFDSMIAAFARSGTVISKNVTGEDITDKTGDANADEQGQINQVTETEQKLQAERMSERRRSALEEQLTEQRSELAQTRSRLGTLRKTAALSTINLTLTERPKKAVPAEPKSTFWSGVGETNHAATVAFQSAIRVPIVLGIWLVALSPVWGPLVLLFRYLARKQASDPR